MKVWVVERVGVYSQGVYGIFDTKGDALDALKEAKLKERDDYHRFFLNSRTLSKRGYDDETSEEIS